jgi:hypothetical protein
MALITPKMATSSQKMILRQLGGLVWVIRYQVLGSDPRSLDTASKNRRSGDEYSPGH